MTTLEWVELIGWAIMLPYATYVFAITADTFER